MKRLATIATVVLFFSACSLTRMPETPTGLAASEDLHNKIELTWEASSGAGVYHIYRGTTPGLVGTEDEYLGSTAINAYIDTTVETEVPYWYVVSAADPFGNNESALSTEASGVAPDLIWGLPVTVAESADTAVLAAGGTSPIIVTATTGSPIIWYEYDEETGWTPAAESPGTAAEPGIINAAVIGGELHAAFTDATASDAITVRRYSDDQWETLGTPYAADTGPVGKLSLTSSGGFINPEVYLGYVDGTDVTVKYYPNAVSEWANLGTFDPSPVTATTVFTLVYDGNTYLIYEEPGLTLSSQVYEDPTGWTVLPTSGAVNSTAGYMAVVAGTNSIYLAYAASVGTLSVKEYSTGAWSDLTSIGSVDTSGPVDLAVLNNTLYAAYVTTTETVVSRYVDEEWEITAVNPDDTLAAADDLDLEVHGGSLRLLTVTGGKVEVRVFE